MCAHCALQAQMVPETAQQSRNLGDHADLFLARRRCDETSVEIEFWRRHGGERLSVEFVNLAMGA